MTAILVISHDVVGSAMAGPGIRDAELARVLAAEHVIYPLSVRWFVEDRLALEGALVRQRDGASQLLI